MRVAVAGATGLIGTALVRSLVEDGHQVTVLVRKVQPTGEGILISAWDPGSGVLDEAAFDGVDAVVNLSGRSIGAKRWSREEKDLLTSSRVDPTALLARTVAAHRNGPRVLLSASAIGIYGDRGDENLTESSERGDGFLADLCASWEAATSPAEEAGVRVCHLRTGLVLSHEGGFLEKPARLTRSFLGGPIGSGDQWWSWIDIADEVAGIRFLLEREVSGPVNLTSPNPETNRNFTKKMGRVLGRPTILPAPGFAVRLLLGRELAEEVVLAGQRVLPAALSAAGFEFSFLDVEQSLASALD